MTPSPTNDLGPTPKTMLENLEAAICRNTQGKGHSPIDCKQHQPTWFEKKKKIIPVKP